MTEGQVYRCQYCGCEIKVVRTSAQARANPRCGCGAPMKKPYSKPTLRKRNSDVEILTISKTNGT
jgi:predicted nucleic acid-binding Zn ribbon protein